MSRIGKKPIEIPAKVKVTIKDRVVTVEGGGATLQMTHRPEVQVGWDESEKSIIVSIDEARMKERQMRAYWGTTRALIQNMVDGVSKGFEKRLEVMGVGYTAAVTGDALELKVGYAEPLRIPIPEGVDVSVERAIVTVKGVDKQKVGQFASKVRKARNPDPYKLKGVRYVGEEIQRKQGKAFGS